jgi:hypothetical protein
MIRLKVMPDSGDAYELTATTRDIAQWEKRSKTHSFAGLQNDMHVKDLYVIAFFASRRKGLFTGTEAEFVETCDLDVLDDEDEADPTHAAAS